MATAKRKAVAYARNRLKWKRVKASCSRRTDSDGGRECKLKGQKKGKKKRTTVTVWFDPDVEQTVVLD